MKRALNIVVLSILILTMFAAIGCSSTTRIGDILANPAQYEGKEVFIKGTVGKTTWFAQVGRGFTSSVMVVAISG